jgi:hypothetical protein
MLRGIRVGLATLLVTLALGPGGVLGQQNSAKPNILMIMGDDIGVWNLKGMMGSLTTA